MVKKPQLHGLDVMFHPKWLKKYGMKTFAPVVDNSIKELQFQ